jgi:DDE domain
MATGDTASDPSPRSWPNEGEEGSLTFKGDAQDPGPHRHSQAATSSKSIAGDPAEMLRKSGRQQLRAGAVPAEVTTDRAPACPRVLDELVPSALHTVEQYANNPIEADHGRLKALLRPMRGLKRHRSARILAAGHAFVQNLRRGHYDIATDIPIQYRLRIAFDDLALTLWTREASRSCPGVYRDGTTQQRRRTSCACRESNPWL